MKGEDTKKTGTIDNWRKGDQLGLAPERDAVLAQLDDRTNQTWAGKRARWAALVRAQDSEIERLRKALFGLAANAGALRAFESEVRAAIGNSNWQAIADYVAQADALRPNVRGEQGRPAQEQR